MSKEIYISKFGYLTPEELEKKLEEVSDSYSEQLKAVGRWTLHLESAKQGALKLGELLGELIEAKAKLDLEEKDARRQD